MKDIEITCNQCGKKKKQSDILLPKGYYPTFIDGYYRCLECFEVDEVYNSLARENERLRLRIKSADKEKALEIENKQLLEKVAALEKALNRACEYQIGHLCSDHWRMSRNCKQSTNIEPRDPCLDCWIDYFMGEI